jgi:hypothetical protein
MQLGVLGIHSKFNWILAVYIIWELRDGKGRMFWKGRARVSDAQDVKGKRGLLVGQFESVHERLQVDVLEKRLECGHLRIRCGKQKVI